MTKLGLPDAVLWVFIVIVSLAFVTSAADIALGHRPSVLHVVGMAAELLGVVSVWLDMRERRRKRDAGC